MLSSSAKSALKSFLKNKNVKPSRKLSTSTVLYSWGVGTNGQLGHQKFAKETGVIGDQSYIQYEPRKLIKSSKFTDIACSYEFTLGLSNDGQVYGWGNDYLPNQQSNEPKHIPLPEKIKSISCGAKHAAAVDVQHNMYTWGNGGSWMKGGGQLGHGSRDSENKPRLVNFFKDYGAKVSKVSCGAHHTLILTTDGEVLATGVGEYCRLGIGSSEDVYTPTSVSTLINENVVDVSASHNHSVCLTSTGKVFAWGKNDSGQLGFADTYMDVLYSQEEYPRQVELLPTIKQISTSKGRTAAVSEEGDLYIWGAQYEHIPTLIDSKLFNQQKIKKVLCVGGTGGSATFVITSDNTLWSFGDTSSALLGRSMNSMKKVVGKEIEPKQIEFHPHVPSPNTTPSANDSSNARITNMKVLDVYGGLGRHAFSKVQVDIAEN